MSLDSGQSNAQIDSAVAGSTVLCVETSEHSPADSPDASDKTLLQAESPLKISSKTSSNPPFVDRSPNHCDNLFVRPKDTERRSFFSQHPVQIGDKPFYHTKDGLPRKWLTFCEKEESLYCSVCLVFGNKMSNFASTGEKDKRHWASRVQEHEASKTHLEAVSDYISWDHNSVGEAFARQLTISKSEIQRKRDFLSRVIDVIKMIGKLGLAIRGKHEASHTLDNLLLNHGVLLEVVLLLSKYDQVTADHVKTCVKKGHDEYEKWKRKGRKGRFGRGKII